MKIEARFFIVFLILILVLTSLTLTGCSDDDDPITPQTGSVNIVVTADLDASWTLMGPEDDEVEGTGSTFLDDLLPGDYTVTWDDLAGFETPTAETQSMSEGETLEFVGTYAEYGSISIQMLPEGINATWTLTGPGDYQNNGQTDVVLNELLPGSYQLSWSDMVGYATPVYETLNLEAGVELSHAGEYVLIPQTSPEGAIEIFKAAMEERDLTLYRHIINEDFIFVPKGDEVAYNYDTEISITNKMFNEIAGEGGIVISNIVVSLLDPQGVWNPIPESDPNFGGFPNSQYRQYEVNFKFYLQGENTVYQSTGFVVVYLTTEQEEFEGSTVSAYKILGFKDQTNGSKSVQNHSWTGVKALFI